jgi:hypothetical protein
MTRKEPQSKQKEDDNDRRNTDQQQSHRFDLGRWIAQLRKTNGRIDIDLTDGRLDVEKAPPWRCANH